MAGVGFCIFMVLAFICVAVGVGYEIHLDVQYRKKMKAMKPALEHAEMWEVLTEEETRARLIRDWADIRLGGGRPR